MTPEDIVRKAEAAYMAQDFDLLRDLFDPEVVVYWGGKKLLEGREQVVEFERKKFASRTNFKIKKTLRAASGDTIAVEWAGSFVLKESGKLIEMHGAEFWKMRNDRLVEWRAYNNLYSD